MKVTSYTAVLLSCLLFQGCFGSRVDCSGGKTPAESLHDFALTFEGDKKSKLEEKVGKLVLKRTMGNLGSMAAMAMTGDDKDIGETLKNDVFKDFCGKTYDQIMAMDN